ncbi:patatin-like phospholipase family protein [Subtercola lobariae]|uniref:Patatin n=1 Tax=Subtercola lobariae TaxID=1588641 RepID=A0A917F3P0_9MICO|nr:patatin-like phospholipase family protein [Subtercola lobariae]GGF42132.1 patatin [Subtercola lobariae]
MTSTSNTRAVVLGGGGITGISWEIGIIAGLADGGIDLTNADALYGTSAGSFTAALIASGEDMETRYRAQFEPDETEVTVAMSTDIIEAYTAAITQNYGRAVPLARAFGRIAMAAETISPERRLEVVKARLGISDWPDDRLHMTAIDAETGELVVLDRSSGLTLTEAANATGAVPGIWPMVEAGGRKWIDGGMLSPANPQLAAGYDSAIIIAPAPESSGGFPSVDQTAAELRAAGGLVTVIVPNSDAIDAIGPNPFDISRRGGCAEAGRRQGLAAATAVTGW